MRGVPDQMLEDVERPAGRVPDALEHFRHAADLGAMSDFEGCELRVLDRGSRKLLIEQVRARIEPQAGAAAARDVLLKPRPRRFSCLAVAEVGKDQDKAEHAVMWTDHGIGP